MPSDNKIRFSLYEKMYLTRKSEEIIIAEYPKDEMKTPMHMSMGEEAIVAGICQALGPKSQVLSSYRSHAVYLIKTGETEKFWSELYGKRTGPAKGKAGSMHLSYPEAGYLGASAVVATQIPVAVGVAYTNKTLKNKKLTAVFFGDGAMDEGVFWESLNMACLWKLPIIFVCEDNDLAIHTSKSKRQGYNSSFKVVSNFNCNTFESETTDAEEIYNLTNKAIGIMSKNKKPIFMRLKYYRYLEHVGVSRDFEVGYRSESEFKKWYKKDPIKLMRDKLVIMGLEKEVIKIEAKMDRLINEGLVKAKAAQFPDSKELFKDVEYVSK